MGMIAYLEERANCGPQRALKCALSGEAEPRSNHLSQTHSVAPCPRCSPAWWISPEHSASCAAASTEAAQRPRPAPCQEVSAGLETVLGFCFHCRLVAALPSSQSSKTTRDLRTVPSGVQTGQRLECWLEKAARDTDLLGLSRGPSHKEIAAVELDWRTWWFLRLVRPTFSDLSGLGFRELRVSSSSPSSTGQAVE